MIDLQSKLRGGQLVIVFSAAVAVGSLVGSYELGVIVRPPNNPAPSLEILREFGPLLERLRSPGICQLWTRQRKRQVTATPRKWSQNI